MATTVKKSAKSTATGSGRRSAGAKPSSNGSSPSSSNGAKPKSNGGKPKSNGARPKSNGAKPRSRANGAVPAPAEDARRVAASIGRELLLATSVETAHHSDDVLLISGAICDQLGVNGAHREDILAAARLHDIGKASLPPGVVEKPSPLSDSEWKRMREHTVIGERILASVPELEGVARMVRHSHERWDGLGYPDGLAAKEIPLGSRIIFCADSFHAIRSDRPYRAGRPAPEALAEVVRGRGTQFDPEIVAALERVARELRLAPARRRRGASGRLAALMMILALGISGSALARSDLLGTPQAGSPAPALVSEWAEAAEPSLLGPAMSGPLGSSEAAAGSPGAASSLLLGSGSTGLAGATTLGGQQGQLPGGGSTDSPSGSGAPEGGAGSTRPSNSSEQSAAADKGRGKDSGNQASAKGQAKGHGKGQGRNPSTQSQGKESGEAGKGQGGKGTAAGKNARADEGAPGGSGSGRD